MRRLAILAVAGLVACGGPDPDAPTRRVRISPGTPFAAVADTLEARGIIDAPRVFRLFARLTGAEDDIKAGTYEFREGARWRDVLGALTEGRVAHDRVTIPEGWEIRRIAPTLAGLIGIPEDSVAAFLLDTAAANRFNVPGPTLEGYLYPATYGVPAGASLEEVVEPMVREYRARWPPEREARADSMGLTEREVATLASIVEKEARVRDEMPTIAAVYLNRLEIGYPLQADPTVQYARGEHATRLLFAHIDEVADNPYNTYTRPGIPPGPIGSPSERAIDAVLHPADVDYLYFVARPDGTHEFNRHLEDHNRARARIRRELEAGRTDTVPGDAGRPVGTGLGPVKPTATSRSAAMVP
ncbi:MAG: endolytic transglycosylase MltG [Gemmatimonadota bacterium]